MTVYLTLVCCGDWTCIEVYHRDRTSPGGGILAYVENCTQTTRLTNLEDEDQEVLWLLLKPKNPHTFQRHYSRRRLLPTRTNGGKREGNE